MLSQAARRALLPSNIGLKYQATRSFSAFEPVDPASLDFGSLGFNYVPTKSTVFCEHKNGAWADDITTGEPFVKIHVLANVLHYGQAIFEGLKAFEHKDGTVALFNPKENAKRMNEGAKRIGMPPVPEDLFLRLCEKVVQENIDYVPPYGTGGSLYLRPFYFGNGAKLGLGRAQEYTLGAISSPVGLYYPTGLKPVEAMVITDYHRAAPKGVGQAKAAGNYAADIVPAEMAVKEGFQVALYLDAAENKYIEEFSSSNFVGISKDGSTFITPKSESVLKSITNIMLRQLAEAKGLKVEVRDVSIEEVMNGSFSEVAACGTAVIVTPVKSISYNGVKYHISDKLDVLEGLYNDIIDLQVGDAEDKFGWWHAVGRK